jgi:hypothetical protein
MGVAGLTWSLALIIGPAAGMKMFALDPAAYWLSCGALGVLAMLVISVSADAPASKGGAAN